MGLNLTRKLSAVGPTVLIQHIAGVSLISEWFPVCGTLFFDQIRLFDVRPVDCKCFLPLQQRTESGLPGRFMRCLTATVNWATLSRNPSRKHVLRRGKPLSNCCHHDDKRSKSTKSTSSNWDPSKNYRHHIGKLSFLFFSPLLLPTT